ncbi:hemerythrin family protein [Azospirillum thermophilum]|uniref:Hemerythrin-like domain-containing protein n=1 Tax=Azospirillum thermophilum TaxID=2202148 RepID=A0A2S2CQ33_9PROT|nr:hemerythrin family protein [Azospirillum thermophilum]AWK86578.1 hypothetical protein DEW08_10290 [Azospirillum thermophilum]
MTIEVSGSVLSGSVCGCDLLPTGAAELDAEHEAILGSLTLMLGQEVVPPDTLRGLRRMMADHFATEAREFPRLRPDRRTAHQEAHDHFLRTVDGLLARGDTGQPVGNADIYPLMLWFVVHSNTADAELAESAGPHGALPDLGTMKGMMAALEHPEFTAS